MIMSSAVDMYLCKDQILSKKGVCARCGRYQCCEPPAPPPPLKWKHIRYNMQYRSGCAANIFKSNDSLDASDSGNKQIKMNIKSSFREKDRIILTDIFGSCDKNIYLSNKKR